MNQLNDVIPVSKESRRAWPFDRNDKNISASAWTTSGTGSSAVTNPAYLRKSTSHGFQIEYRLHSIYRTHLTNTHSINIMTYTLLIARHYKILVSKTKYYTSESSFRKHKSQALLRNQSSRILDESCIIINNNKI